MIINNNDNIKKLFNRKKSQSDKIILNSIGRNFSLTGNHFNNNLHILKKIPSIDEKSFSFAQTPNKKYYTSIINLKLPIKNLNNFSKCPSIGFFSFQEHKQKTFYKKNVYKYKSSTSHLNKDNFKEEILSRQKFNYLNQTTLNKYKNIFGMFSHFFFNKQKSKIALKIKKQRNKSVGTQKIVFVNINDLLPKDKKKECNNFKGKSLNLSQLENINNERQKDKNILNAMNKISQKLQYFNINNNIIKNPNLNRLSPKTKRAINKNLKVSSFSLNNSIKEDTETNAKNQIEIKDLFKNKKQSDNINKVNIQKIIYNVIENNKKVDEFRTKYYFNAIGKSVAERKMIKSSCSFHKEIPHLKVQEDEQFKKKSIPPLEFVLYSTKKWKNHLKAWEVLTLYNGKLLFEDSLFPPDNDFVVIGEFFCLFIKNAKDDKYIYMIKENEMMNPRLEINKWKYVYKRIVLRWHPDKLTPLLNKRLQLDETKKKKINDISTVILNSAKEMYKKIVDKLVHILNK